MSLLRWLLKQRDKYHIDPLHTLLAAIALGIVGFVAPALVHGTALLVSRTLIFMLGIVSFSIGLYQLLDAQQKGLARTFSNFEQLTLGVVSGIRAGERAIPQTGLESAIAALANRTVECHARGKYPLVEDMRVNIALDVLEEESQFERFRIGEELSTSCCWFRFGIDMEWKLQPAYRGQQEMLSVNDIFGPILVTTEETVRELVQRRLLDPRVTVYWPADEAIVRSLGLDRLKRVRFLLPRGENREEDLRIRIVKHVGDRVGTETEGRWTAAGPDPEHAALGLLSALGDHEGLSSFDRQRFTDGTLQAYSFTCEEAGDIQILAQRRQTTCWRVRLSLDYVLPMKVLDDKGRIIRDNRLYTHPFNKVTSLASMIFHNNARQVHFTSALRPFIHCVLGDVTPRLDGSAWHVVSGGTYLLPGDEISFLWDDHIVQRCLAPRLAALRGTRASG